MALFIAVQTYATERRGRSEWITLGDAAESNATEKSWVLDAYPDAFEPLEVRWEGSGESDALFIAVTTFVTSLRGHDEWVNAGEIAGAGSWVLDAHPEAFRPLFVKWRAPAPNVHLSAKAAKAASGFVTSDSLASPAVSPATLHKSRGGGRPRKIES